jgi:hypothetical protein
VIKQVFPEFHLVERLVYGWWAAGSRLSRWIKRNVMTNVVANQYRTIRNKNRIDVAAKERRGICVGENEE